MGFLNTPFELKSSDFQEDKRLRHHYKLMLNAGLGKLAQRQKQSRSFFATTEEEITKLSKDLGGNEKITNIYGISDSLCQVYSEDTMEGKSNLGNLKSTANGNPILYAFITARTRILIHKNINLLRKHNFTVYYCDCDSIFFVGNESCTNPLDVGLAFGQFRAELKEEQNIQSFVAHGRKNFKLTYKEGAEDKTLFKLSGISLKSPLSKSAVNDIYSNEVEEDIGSNQKVAQIRHVHKKKLSTTVEIQNVSVRQNVVCQRKVDYSQISKPTYPWGLRSNKK